MYEIDAEKMSFSTLNELIRKTAQSDIVIHNCCGQRYIASGMSQCSWILFGRFNYYRSGECTGCHRRYNE